MGFVDDSDIWKVDEEDIDEPVRFRDRVTECPNCKQSITEDMDSCPFCGDILFRYLKDGTFSLRRGPLVKVVAVVIITLILLGVLAFVLTVLGIL